MRIVSWLGLAIGIAANVIILYTCNHVMSVYDAGPLPNKGTALLPVWAMAWLALLVGTPIAILAFKRGEKFPAICGLIANLVAIVVAVMYGGMTSFTIMF
jgi:hypothetical protein